MLKKFKVRLIGQKRPVIVEAGYMRIDGGALWFRNPNYNSGYPQMVRCFACGVWQDVESLDVCSDVGPSQGRHAHQ